MNTLPQIAAAVTPAVMVSACGLVALGLDNQTARMANRLRELVREFRADDAPSRRSLLAHQVRVLDRRHALYSRALLMNYGALFAFVLTSLIWLGEAFLAIPSEIPVITFAVGVVLLAAMALLVIRSIMLARKTVKAEAADVIGERAGHALGQAAPAGAR
jgi:hypothetical protein